MISASQAARLLVRLITICKSGRLRLPIASPTSDPAVLANASSAKARTIPSAIILVVSAAAS
tara:strand:- start:1808 stop:1993 length:186 start_codon:yes stop_codon:yes gene_type:complete